MTVVIGTAGHIDHGKTTLLRALTGIDADRLPEERRRGMTIDVGYAHLALPDGTELDFVDVPGHDRLVGNMLVGAGEVDAAILVVAADDGPRAQTIEHLALLDALAIGHGLAIVTKIDLAGPERTAEVVEAVRRLLDGKTLAGSPVVAVSSVSGEGIDAVRSALIDLRDQVVRTAARTDPRPGTRLAIDRVFAVKGRGAVVTGTLRGRPLARGATLRLVPGDGSVRVREVQVHGAAVEVAEPGRTALNLAGIEARELHRGFVLTDDQGVAAADRLLVALALPLPDRTRIRVHLGTAAVDGSVGRSGRDGLDLADGTAAAIIRLASPLAVAAGDRFVLRRGSGSERIVGGVVLDAGPARGISRRRQTAHRIARLAAAVGTSDATEAAAARLDLHGAVAPAAGEPGPATVAPDVEDAVQAVVLAAISSTAGAASLTEARATATRALRRTVTLRRVPAAEAASAIVERLVADGRLIRDGASVAIPGATPSHAPDPALAAAMDRLEQALAVAAPPALADAARAASCPTSGIRELERAGRIVVLEPDLAYASTTYRDIAATALVLAASAALTPAALRDATGTSRKYVMAILEDLDRRGILRRTAEGHVPGPRAGFASSLEPAGPVGR
ncbi:MAG: selenocysteine-specific translation elongation factor [Chloroflexota bacterium]